MVKSCYLCRSLSQKGDNRRSFHRFPDPQYQKEAWCQSLKLDIKKVRGWTFICSDHFVPESFNYRSNGTRFLKDDAVPRFYDGPVRPRKAKYSRPKSKLDPANIKAECESQENENEALNKNIKQETPDALEEENHVFIKTEKDLEESQEDEITITENIIIKTEITEESNIIEEESFAISPADVHLGGDSKDIVLKPFELSKEFEYHNGDYSKTNNDTNMCDEKIEGQPYIERIKTKKTTILKSPLAQYFKTSYPKRKASEYACIECTFTTTSRIILRGHFLGHREADFKKNPAQYQFELHRCKECDYVTIQKKNLSRHMVKHQPADGSQVKVYSCDECGYFTKYRCDLVKHRIKHVNVEYRFKCLKCEYRSHESSHLREHMKKGHVEGKKYKYECEKCPYKTDCRGSLNRHNKESHSENKKFKYECDSCSFKIDSKWSWNLHNTKCRKRNNMASEEGTLG